MKIVKVTGYEIVSNEVVPILMKAKDRMESGEKSNRLYYKTVKIEWEE